MLKKVGAVREMQIKATVRYYLTAVRMVLSTRQIMTSVGEVMEKEEPSLTSGGNID